MSGGSPVVLLPSSCRAGPGGLWTDKGSGQYGTDAHILMQIGPLYVNYSLCKPYIRPAGQQYDLGDRFSCGCSRDSREEIVYTLAYLSGQESPLVDCGEFMAEAPRKIPGRAGVIIGGELTRAGAADVTAGVWRVAGRLPMMSARGQTHTRHAPTHAYCPYGDRPVVTDLRRWASGDGGRCKMVLEAASHGPARRRSGLDGRSAVNMRQGQGSAAILATEQPFSGTALLPPEGEGSRKAKADRKHMRRKDSTKKKLDVSKLSHVETKEVLARNLREQIKKLPAESNPEKAWGNFRKVMYDTSERTLGHTKRKHQDWFDNNNEEITSLLKKKQEAFTQWLNDKNSTAKHDHLKHLRSKVQGVRNFENNRLNELEKKRQERKEKEKEGRPTPSTAVVCPTCGRICASAFGLRSHQRRH
uniref:C2H2-type domain-containing protein n=1 Tax=Branchiostoma floridae TaxID=7739 RepID=C3ZYV1_BRAFL|eukprot:XP_002586259.1 hypothetical protein BRAFLDRAFT_109345 [Branchiostoma floridae]